MEMGVTGVNQAAGQKRRSGEKGGDGPTADKMKGMVGEWRKKQGYDGTDEDEDEEMEAEEEAR